MSILRFRFLFLALLPAAAFGAASDPVGVFRVSLRGNSDTMVSLPLHRPALGEGTIVSRSDAQLTLESDVAALPAGGAYVLVMSGALEGAILPVTGLSGRTLTIAAGDYDLATLKTEAIDGEGNADLVAVIPYWTLDALFPGGQGVNVSPNALSPQTQILLFNHETTGINQAAAETYYYYSGTALVGPGWYKVGVPTQLAGATILAPTKYFIVRHNAATATELLVAGHVQLSAYRVPLATRAANTDQDNFVAWPLPISTPLGASNLVESGAFAVTTNPLLLKDQLFRFDNATAGKNKAATATYYYYQGTALQGTGWYKVGEPKRLAGQDVVSAGEALLIRKKKTTTPTSQSWTGLPTYLQ